jgi:hypothetical protein
VKILTKEILEEKKRKKEEVKEIYVDPIIDHDCGSIILQV